GLGAQVGEQVDGGLLHGGVRDGSAVVVIAVQPPGPTDRARPEDEGAAGGAVERQAVRRPTGFERVAVLPQTPRGVGRGGRQGEEASWPGAIINVLVPLVTQRAVGQRSRLIGGQRGHARVAPEAQMGVEAGDRNGPRLVAVDGEEGAGQTVLGPAAVGRRAEARVAPVAGPDVRQRVGLGVVERFLVADQRAIGRAGAVDAVLPARLPKAFIPTEKRQADAGVAGGLDVGALVGRPVFVVAHRQEDLVVLDLAAPAGAVHVGKVADVVAVGLQPADHGILGVEDVIEAAEAIAARAVIERTVVAHLVGPADAAIADVGAVSAVLVV